MTRDGQNYSNWYKRISSPFRGEAARAAFACADRALVYLFAGAYAVGLVALIAARDGHALRFALVPAVTFALVTIVRARIDAPRPSEQFDIDPLIRKDTRGKSMPSRHMASATIIAIAFAWVCMPAGIAGAFGCLAVAFTRIVGGVHFPRDIVAAAAISTVCGSIGFLALPYGII